MGGRKREGRASSGGGCCGMGRVFDMSVSRTTCTTVHFCVDWAVFNTGRGPLLTKNMTYIKRVGLSPPRPTPRASNYGNKTAPISWGGNRLEVGCSLV